MFFALKGVPYAFFRERFLRLLLPERMQIPTVAIINGEPRELLRLEGPTEPRKKGVIQMTQYVPLERHPLAPAIAVFVLFSKKRLRHHLQRHPLPATRRCAVLPRQKHHSLRAAPHGGNHLQVPEVQRVAAAQVIAAAVAVVAVAAVHG